MVLNPINLIVIKKLFFRIFLFIFFYSAFLLPIQISAGEKIISSLNGKFLGPENNYELEIIKNRINVNSKNPSYNVFRFNLPFGFYYFLMLFILWFKPIRLINALSIYDIILIPSYSIFIFFFFKGYDFFIIIINITNGFYKITYATIFFLKVLRLNIFNLFFDIQKK